MTAGDILGDAWRLYRLLFRRSIAIATVVTAVVTSVDAARYASSRQTAFALSAVAFVLAFAGQVIIQGALIELVRNVHEGRAAARISSLLERVGDRFWPLIRAALIYSFGIGLGFLALIVPGLIIWARWSLMAPLVVLEEMSRGITSRSSSLVAGKTKTVLLALLASFAIAGVPPYIVFASSLGLRWQIPFSFVWGSLTAPFTAYVLTVAYYRIVDPEQPVINSAVRTWKSVWNGA